MQPRRPPLRPAGPLNPAAAPQVAAEYAERILESLRQGEAFLPSVSRYRIVRTLGEGGMGTVFLADQVSEGGIRKPVAIKVLKDTTGAEAIARFVEEAQLLAQLAQGSIVELIALESMELQLRGRRNPRTGGFEPPRRSKLYFMVMEYVNGPSFEAVLRRHADAGLLMHPAVAAFILNKSAIALAEAHGLADAQGRPVGLAHRDLTPSNILFNARAGITKLADFGVARVFDADGGQEIVGKPRYMAPEQLDGEACPASDLWALGVCGYEALTGFAPYRPLGTTFREKALALRTQFAKRLRPPAEILAWRDPRFDLEALSALILRCLDPDPKARPSAVELSAALEAQVLYAKGLGPTNKTLAALLRLLDMAIGDGEVVPDAGWESSDDGRTLCATLGIDAAPQAFRRRVGASYHPDFVRAIKAGGENPCVQ